MKWICVTILGLLTVSCAFNIELTTQRTALENQVMGAHKEIEDELLLIAIRRDSIQKQEKKNLTPVQKAVMNQRFNRDDLMEMMALQMIGESTNGTVRLTPQGMWRGSRDKYLRTFASKIIREENQDRDVLAKEIIRRSNDLELKDLARVKRTLSLVYRRSSPLGLVQNSQGQWVKVR